MLDGDLGKQKLLFRTSRFIWKSDRPVSRTGFAATGCVAYKGIDSGGKVWQTIAGDARLITGFGADRQAT